MSSTVMCLMLGWIQSGAAACIASGARLVVTPITRMPAGRTRVGATLVGLWGFAAEAGAQARCNGPRRGARAPACQHAARQQHWTMGARVFSPR